MITISLTPTNDPGVVELRAAASGTDPALKRPIFVPLDELAVVVLRLLRAAQMPGA